MSQKLEALQKYLEKVKSKKTYYICSDFDSSEVKEIIKIADFVYLDPPYLITNATYNESNKWKGK